MLQRLVAKFSTTHPPTTLSSLIRSVGRRSLYSPAVFEQTSLGERGYDLFSRLLKDRIVCLYSPIRTESASHVVASLLYLDMVDPTQPIHFYINSPGGSVPDGMAIYDTIQYIRAEVHTVAMGMAASMGSLLLAAGTKGKRFALPNARVMLHQPLGGAQVFRASLPFSFPCLLHGTYGTRIETGVSLPPLLPLFLFRDKRQTLKFMRER